MKTISTTAIVALMTTAIGLTAVAPAMAQQESPHAQTQFHSRGQAPDQANRQQRWDQRGRQDSGLAGMLSFGRNAEHIEVALVRLGYRLDLTAEQKTLLESLKTAALAAQADFVTAVQAVHPDPAATARPDISARLDMRIAIESAHVDALKAVQAPLQALFASLTDEQKAQLGPRQGHRMQRHEQQGNNDGPRHQRPERHRPNQGQERPNPATPALPAPAATPALPAPTNG